MKSILIFYCIIHSALLSFIDLNPNNGSNHDPNTNCDKIEDCARNITFIDANEITLQMMNEDYWLNSVGGYNEDADLDFIGLTKKYGYPTETHTVTTEDGYILTMFRITKGIKCNGDVKKTPVVMMHGVMDSSDAFIISGPDSGLGYVLADECYEIWLANHRGNTYSRKHVHYSADKHSAKYWNFTFNEHGIYDLKAVVDYVLDYTKSKKVSYIGHSQGTTQFFVLASELPEYNEKIAVSVALAPIAWLDNMKAALLKVIALADREIKAFLDLFGTKALFNRDDATDKFLELLCRLVPKPACSSLIFLGFGGDPKLISKKTIQAIFGYYPTATSVKNLVHFAQIVNSKQFRKYDYGSEQNFEIYGTNEPPEYNVSRITAPVALLCSTGDLLSSTKDVAKLRPYLQNEVHYSEMGLRWGHTHYVWAKTVPSEIAPTVLNLLEKYGS